jgi:hypothetical protein
MSTGRKFVSTSISIHENLLERAKVRAMLSYRTFSQYVSYLIDQDLVRNEKDARILSNSSVQMKSMADQKPYS